MLAVGGCEANGGDCTISIHQYINTSWIVVGHMASIRAGSTTAALPSNKLMVVGGGPVNKCDIATVK